MEGKSYQVVPVSEARDKAIDIALKEQAKEIEKLGEFREDFDTCEESLIILKRRLEEILREFQSNTEELE